MHSALQPAYSPLFNKNPPNNMENRMVRLANRLAVATLLKAVAKHKQTAAATKLNRTSTIKNFRNTYMLEFKPIM